MDREQLESERRALVQFRRVVCEGGVCCEDARELLKRIEANHVWWLRNYVEGKGDHAFISGATGGQEASGVAAQSP